MRVLTLDIETCPIDAYTFSLYQPILTPAHIKKPTRILAWAAKWEDSDEVLYASEKNYSHEDMILAAYELVDEADAIITYNGVSFDMKELNREFIELDLPPPSLYKNIDLFIQVKKLFKFPSYKLEYVASVLLGENKLSTGGIALWIACLNGDKKAWETMEDYNIQDVLLTEGVYKKIQGWIPNHPNRALWVEDQENPICPNCKSTNLVKKGIEFPARVNAYQRYKCKDCGANSRGREVLKKAGPGVLM